eukprot:900890-Alexandrium_andersonii.AAC.1
MSASLVGSEMCIRDRAFSEAFRGAPETGASYWVLSSDKLTRSDLPECKTCLLYTSDAADDM